VPSIQPPSEPIRTIDGLTGHVRAAGLTRVDEVIAALPEDIRGQLSMMSNSRSRYKASVDHPRLILYGDTARFIVGISSHPDDPLRETIEMAELLPEVRKLVGAIPDRFGNLVAPGKPREWSSERFNYVLARSMTLQLSTRMRNSVAYGSNRRALILALECGDGDARSLPGSSHQCWSSWS